jgi:hypothetical protein
LFVMLVTMFFVTSAGAAWTHIPSTDPGWVTNSEMPIWSPSSYGWTATGDDDSVIALWQSNEYAEYLFTGTQVRLYGIKSSEGVTADIRIDGEIAAAGVSWYTSGQPEDHVMLFESAVLSAAAHTFRVDNPGDWINIDYIEIVSTEDTSPPTPDPMTWLAVPVAFPGNEIVMTATTAVDPAGVEYYFDETTGGPGSTDSGWQDSTSYTDTGLSDGTQYCYQVRARDKSVNQNATAYSSTECATSYTNPPTTDYYIDSVGGDDGADGLTPSTAWKSHTKVHTVTLKPGDSVQFKRGSQFSGPIVISESGAAGSPILLTDYDTGNAPRFTNPDDLDMNGNCIRISGDYIIVENLYFHDTPPTDNEDEFESIFKMGAIFNMPGADHNIIRDNVFMDCTKGIQSTGEYTLITGNYLDGPDHPLWWDGIEEGAWGPMGIHLGIGNQEISYNTILNHLTTESPYGVDGGAIEFDDGRWHKDNLYVHHNYSEGNAGFFESSWEADTPPQSQEVHNLRIAFNISNDGSHYMYLWAPTHDSYFDDNVANRNNSYPNWDSQDLDFVVASFSGATFRNNLNIGNQYVSGHSPYWGSVTVENDWYWEVGTGYGDGDPLLVDYDNGDYHLTSSSPLIDQAQNLSQHYSTDFDGATLPTSGPWDIGAYMYVGVDTTPPTPDPMTWQTVPNATGESSIAMTATTATDPSGVEYYFDETTGGPGGSDSGWQDSTSYTDTGLNSGTQYCYEVAARDKSVNQNETAASSNQCATTQAPDTDPPTPDPMTWATVPYSTGPYSVAMDATTATDVSGVEYYFTNTAGGGNDSGWQDGIFYEDTGLTPETQYTYTVTARDKSANQNATAASSAESATTDAEPVSGLKMDIGVAAGVSSGSWDVVSLSKSYTSPVVIATANYDNTSDPVAVRIQNASGSSFDVTVQAAGGSAPSNIDVYYMVVEEGVYTVAGDGVKMEAVTYNSTVTDENNSWVGQPQAYSNTYTSPVVLGQVMTYADSGFSTFWCFGSARANPPDTTNLNTGKSVAEDTDTTRNNETVGYIVIEAGSGSMAGTNYVAAVGSDIVAGVTNAPPYTYSISGLSDASVAIASLSAMDGGNGGWALLYGANPVSATSINLVIDEDIIGDTERSHTAEQVAYIVFEETAAPDTTPPTPDPMTWATVPYSTGTTSIAMVATTATDASGVEYYFMETSANPGGSDSGWQDSTSYTDSGLNPSTQYCYEVQARDKSVNQNLTAWSTNQCATTDAEDTTPPTPDPMTWVSVPSAGSDTAVSMTATTASDLNGVEYYFDETSLNPGGSDSGWQDPASYTDTGLSAETQYCYQVQARDKSVNQNATAWSTTECATTQATPDTTPPTPDPMTWASVPAAGGTDNISMTATTASDPSGVEYNFDETSGNPGGSDSGWQDSTSYTDTGLNDSTQYCYRVQARDKSVNQNATAYSSTECATTDAIPDTDPPTPDPMTWASVPAAASSSQIDMTATTASDPSGVQYSFDETSGNPGATDSGWQTSASYSDTGLDPDTQYCYQVKARDMSVNQNETAFSTNECATTQAGGWTQIIYDDFEGGFGNWNDGGTDCLLYTEGTYAHQGSNAADLQDNTTTSVMTTNNLDLSAYSEVKVDFWYICISMDKVAEDFWLQISTNGGSSFDTVEEWNLDDEFVNGTFYPDSVTITGYTLTSTTQLRFRCDASGDKDDVYIDEVLVSASGEPVPDTDPPTPNPATFASTPAAISSSAISMTATTGSDASPPVEYYFDETSLNPGGSDSGWQTSPSYTDSGLDASTQYTYTVQMRDSVPNTGTASSPASATTPAGGLEETFESYSVVTQAGSPQGYVVGSDSTQANMELYESTNNDGVSKGSLFSTFTSGSHGDAENNVENFWGDASGDPYPFAGKSTVGRGSDSGEGNTPAPTGVYDITMHPPSDSHLTVAAFIVPTSGNYSVSNLAVRCVLSSGATATLKVFNASQSQIASLQATTNQDWVTDAGPYDLGSLTAGNSIYFAVDNDGDFAYDSTEIAWTVTNTQ